MEDFAVVVRNFGILVVFQAGYWLGNAPQENAPSILVLGAANQTRGSRFSQVAEPAQERAGLF